MSDLAGYTKVSGILKEPGYVLNLMNDYLEETSLVLQDKYNGWF
jgi:adenylate cyclase